MAGVRRLVDNLMRQKLVTASVRQARVADVPLLVRLEREFDRDERQLTLKETPRLKP